MAVTAGRDTATVQTTGPGVRVSQAFTAAVAVTRVATLLYAATVVAAQHDRYAHPRAGLAVLAAMVACTAAAVAVRSRAWWWHALDLGTAAAALLSTRLIDTSGRIESGSPTLPTIWVAGAVVAVAVSRGARAGTLGGAALAAASVVERGALTQPTVNGAMLLVLTGGLVGLAATAVREATERVVVAERAAEATAERARLARDIHDGVLQLLTVLVRMDPDVVLPDGKRLAVAAADQERSVRRLLTAAEPVGEGLADLVELLPTGPHVHVVGPATPVLLAAVAAHALAAAVGAAIDNVRVHVDLDADVHILVDDLGPEVQVLVRDDGPGMPAGAEERAAAAGRLGFVGMRARLDAVGGTLCVESPAGGGTEVLLTVPRRPS